jgi:hypothetical protein
MSPLAPAGQGPTTSEILPEDSQEPFIESDPPIPLKIVAEEAIGSDRGLQKLPEGGGESPASKPLDSDTCGDDAWGQLLPGDGSTVQLLWRLACGSP